ncbi:hypothetical protein GUJ93_ZPchr0001g32129 [Zizania palustris]|uniref:Uncharacterized protein n=1 Tax=Zizania palustris TaxID=103762 RepID=A0A8J5RP85_ZIZPA|nr:hypothetical protein GUJ93_ZPchr0001g32129 [Zizania palustris]
MVGSLVAILARSCWQLAVAAVQFPALFCCDAMLWTVTFLTFPLRLLAAVDGERKLGEMQRQMERLVWENRELDDKLNAALRENRVMEEILDEMEEEHDDAFARITLLEKQLKVLKLENMRLNEHEGKSTWDKRSPAAVHGGGYNLPGSKANTWKAKDEIEEEGGGVAPEVTAESLTRREKTLARRRSLFSLGMSLAVGAVAWTADAPCLPLLAGLFAMVTMSMCSVARFLCAALRSRPASDAIALLSLNCFLLGVLTSPMLPAAVRLVGPAAAPLSS